MVNKKKRRHSGRYTPNLTIPIKALLEEDLFLNEEYDDWDNYRDSWRKLGYDNTKITKNVKYIFLRYNTKFHERMQKQKIFLQRRRMRK